MLIDKAHKWSKIELEPAIEFLIVQEKEATKELIRKYYRNVQGKIVVSMVSNDLKRNSNFSQWKSMAFMRSLLVSVLCCQGKHKHNLAETLKLASGVSIIERGRGRKASLASWRWVKDG